MLIAVQLMCSLALAAVVYLIFFSNADLFKIAGCTAIAAIPLVCWVLLKNKSSAQIVTKFEPWLYVSHAMQTLGLGNWFNGPLAFAVVALPIYLVGCLGLRVIGIPAILTAIIRPRPGGAVRFLLGIFVVIGVVIALTCSFTPAGWTFRYNPISSTFLVQSEYVAWIFAVEVFQTFYQWAIRRGIYPALAAGGIIGYCSRAQFTCDGAALRSLARPGSLLRSRETLGQTVVNLRSANVGGHGFPAEGCAPG